MEMKRSPGSHSTAPTTPSQAEFFGGPGGPGGGPGPGGGGGPGGPGGENVSIWFVVSRVCYF